MVTTYNDFNVHREQLSTCHHGYCIVTLFIQFISYLYQYSEGISPSLPRAPSRSLSHSFEIAYIYIYIYIYVQFQRTLQSILDCAKGLASIVLLYFGLTHCLEQQLIVLAVDCNSICSFNLRLLYFGLLYTYIHTRSYTF